MACMEDLLLQEGCSKAYATFCLGGVLKYLIRGLILLLLFIFHVLDLCFYVSGLYLVSWTCILGACLVVGCLSSSWVHFELFTAVAEAKEEVIAFLLVLWAHFGHFIRFYMFFIHCWIF